MGYRNLIFVSIVLVVVVVLMTLGALTANNPLLGGIISMVIIVGGIASVMFYKPFREWLESLSAMSSGLHAQKCRVLLIGLGRSGKTSIIHRILTEDAALQEESTNEFNIYDEVKRIGLQNPNRYIVSIADYKGQRLSQITVEHPVQFFGRPGQCLINALIFVVDLFPELTDADGRTLKDEELIELYAQDADQKITDRVSDQLEYLTKYTIEQIFTLAYSERNLMAVKLIVNKVDLVKWLVIKGYLPDVTEENIEDYVHKLYNPMMTALENACQVNNIEGFAVHLVSAKTSEGIHQVLSEILESYHHRRQR